jgi:predicted metalloprotease
MKDNLRLDVENIYCLITLNCVYFFKHFLRGMKKAETTADIRSHYVISHSLNHYCQFAGVDVSFDMNKPIYIVTC